MSLTRSDRKVYFNACRRLALMVERACDVTTSTAMRYKLLRKTIADQEKGHRRFAPVAWRHRFSVEQAVDYFVVRTIAQSKVDATALSLSMMRDDYVLATFLMCDPGVRERLDKYVGEVWVQPAARVFEILGDCDYSALSGTDDKPDPETVNAIAWARAYGDMPRRDAKGGA